MMKNGKPIKIREVPSVKRATSILWYLAKRKQGARLSHIARDLEIIPSTCLHILRELGNAGFVSLDANSLLYRLGPAISAISQYLTFDNAFAEAARPCLDQIAAQFSVTVTAIEIADEHHLMIVAGANGVGSPLADVRTGDRLPVLAGAAGRCIAAYSDWDLEALKLKFERVRWAAPPTFDDWLREVDQARTNGYAIDVGNFFRGITVISVPVFGLRSMVGVLVAAAISEQMTSETINALIVELKRQATIIGSQIGAS